jgi:predicted metal-dependent HD superfamily phosphohydrolase
MKAGRDFGIATSGIEAAAAALYDPSLPYHNFGHALDTVASGERIVERCRAEGIRIDEQVVYLALLFHDSGYRDNHAALGFQSKEQYSAHLARQALSEHGFKSRLIDKVDAAILATHRFAEFRTSEQKAVRAADLSGLAADYEVFRDNGELLRQEQELLTGIAVPADEWVASVTEVVRFYLQQEIRLTSFFYDENGQSDYHRRVAANLARLRAEAGL